MAYQSIFNKQPVTTTSPIIQEKTLPGGGAYKSIFGQPNALVKTPRSNYGGLPTKSGYERADIVPVSLAGVNSNPANITYEKYPWLEVAKDKISKLLGKDYVPQTKTDQYLMNEVLPAYKSGKIDLREAQVKAVSYLKTEQMGVDTSVIGNLGQGIKDTFNQIGQGVKKM